MFKRLSQNITRSSFSIPAIVCLLALQAACSSSGSDSAGTTEPAGQNSGDVENQLDVADDDTSTEFQASDNDESNPGSNVSEIQPDRILSALPNPPLTPAPGADSEPVRATGPITNVREFFVVRNPTRDLVDTFGELTDEDFEAGPLPPVYYVPDDVDTSTNSLPHFDNLTDVEVFAGEELSVRFRPLDVDGGIPGLFPNAIPPGARYVDNFDGTRSLIWTPLEPDVGIREFTITATDPVAPFYRTERTIRIKIKMPSDPDNVINKTPGINLIRPHTVRVNDLVVAYIKVTDPNGTIPSLEIENLPAGATIVDHYSDPNVSILRFTPTVAETITLDLVAIDSRDPALRATKSVTLEVLEPVDFDRPGSRLRDLAANRDLLIGYASLLGFYERPDGAVYADIAGEEFNFVSTENSLKWDLVNPLPGAYRWAQADNLVQHAKARRMAVHGHTLIWHRQLPGWIQRSALEDREIHMREYIDRVLSRYRDDIPVWDVVNEALEEDGSYRNSTWFAGMGESYIDTAFRQSRLSAPDAVLLYNDYDISFAGPKADGMIQLMQSLKDAGTPVDGVGFQMHLDADFNRYDEVATIFQTVADMDLDIYITELDVSIRSGMTEEQQADVFEQVLSLCLEQPRCKAYQTWGFTDMYSWRDEYNPLILDERYQAKPGYLAIQRRLGDN